MASSSSSPPQNQLALALRLRVGVSMQSLMDGRAQGLKCNGVKPSGLIVEANDGFQFIISTAKSTGPAAAALRRSINEKLNGWEGLGLKVKRAKSALVELPSE
ncbi:hypothetical protein QQP08_004217 [Theobroma cacao]|nr:hypothetical protein QQP08_004217 [Theobroma cacao]